jgi:hypothetical protein
VRFSRGENGLPQTLATSPQTNYNKGAAVQLRRRSYITK